MGKDRKNPGVVDVERAAENIVGEHGGMNSVRRSDGSIHHTAFSKDEERRLSWNEQTDGTITDVHTTSGGKDHVTYKRGR